MATVASVRVNIDRAALAAFFAGQSGPLMVDLLRRGRNVETRAKQLCPVDTGRLRASIGPPRPTTIDALPAVLVGSDVEYSLWVEAGTRRMAARLYLTRALPAAAE